MRYLFSLVILLSVIACEPEDIVPLKSNEQDDSSQSIDKRLSSLRMSSLMDTVPPTILCPLDQFTELGPTGLGQVPSYIDLGIFSDDITAVEDLIITQVPAPGSSGPSIAQVCLYATDEAGNSAECCFGVTGVDGTPPTITNCPPDMIVPVNADCQVNMQDYTGLINVWDDMTDPQDIVVTQSPLAGTPLGGTTVITLTAEDSNGNTSTCSFLLTGIDDEGPIFLNCPLDTMVTADMNGDYIIPDFGVMLEVTDNCTAGGLIYTQDPVVGTIVSGVGTEQMIFLTFVDANGNASTCEFMLTLE